MEPVNKNDAGSKRMLAAIRLKGLIGVKSNIADTLNMLRLYKTNYCCVLNGTPLYEGMLKTAKDFITWGEIDEDTFNQLVSKRGEDFKGSETDRRGKIKYNDFMLVDNRKIKKYFRLNAPRKGLGKKGLKHTFREGGALGYRGDKINDLIKRML